VGYGYDTVGNRTEVRVDGSVTESRSYNAANQVDGWAYDAAGSPTSDGTTTYVYDALNRLTTQGSTTNTYTGDGTLVAQMTGATTTRFTQDLVAPLSQVLQRTVGSTTTDYLYGHDRLLALDGIVQTWYGSDALGSVRQTLDATGTPADVLHYDPWGSPQDGAAPPAFGFTGELQDTSGLVYLRARWYQPHSGTLLGRDPFAGFPQQPYSLHPYQYAYADPVRRTDPSGECIPEDIPGLGQQGCGFLGWNPLNWNWADGKAYYDGPAGTIGKLAAMALFPPSAYVFGAENFTRGYIRYNENPSWCNGALVFTDGVLLFLPVASFLKGGGGPTLSGSGALALNSIELHHMRQLTQAGIGYQVAGHYVYNAMDPSGTGATGGDEVLFGLNHRIRGRTGAGGPFKQQVPQAKHWEELGLDPFDPSFPDQLLGVMNNSKRIHFDLTDMRAINGHDGVLSGPKELNARGSTNWELRTIWDNAGLRAKTTFYRNGQQISEKDILKLP